jgi:hypothetical protein
VTPEYASRSFMIIRSSMIIFGMVVGMSISTNAETTSGCGALPPARCPRQPPILATRAQS